MSFAYMPNEESLQQTNLHQLIKKLGLPSKSDLYSKAAHETEWFWGVALKEIGLEFETPPQKILEQGLPFPKWATGGKLSLVHHCIDRHLKTAAHETALIFESDEPAPAIRWSFQDLARESSWISRQLLNAGAKPGDRVALIMPMTLEMCAAFFGILRIGLTVVPIFSGYGAEAIRDRLVDAEIKFAFVPKVASRRGKPVDVEHKVQSLQKDCPHLKEIFVLDRTEFLNGGHQVEVVSPVVTEAEAECLLLYTSGTTGKPKACVHTVFGVLATCGKEHHFSFDVQPKDRFFWYTDIGWMMGPWELLGALQLRSCVVLYEGVPDYPNTDRLWKMLEEHEVSHFGISPTAIRLLKKSDSDFLRSCSFEKLRILGSTGEPWDEESWTWFFEKVGQSKRPIINISGGTEIMGCLLSPDPLSKLKPTSLSGPALGVRAEIWSEEGKPIEKGLGHLVCLSPLPSMTKGFLGSKEKYLQTYFEKFGEKVWYHGDWAVKDEDGAWFLKGRSDDTIKIAGKRVGPNEFESCVMENLKVAEAAAVGLPHSVKGEGVYLFIVPKLLKSASEEFRNELKQLVTQKMGKALQAEEILFVRSLPKTRSGKILRSLIRKIRLEENFDDSAVENPQSLQDIKESF